MVPGMASRYHARQNSGMESCLQFGKHLAGIKDDFACGGGHVGAGEIIGGAQVDDGALQSIGRSRNHGHLRIRFARDEYGIGFTDAGDDDFHTVFARVAYCQDTHTHIFDDVTQKGRMARAAAFSTRQTVYLLMFFSLIRHTQ